MKAYTFINSYVCGIQVGIQAGHANVELAKDADCNDEVRRWADHHKTFVWLNGGDSDDMAYVLALLTGSGLPFSRFFEPGMGGLLTASTVLLNESQCNCVELLRSSRGHKIQSDFGKGHVVLDEMGKVLVQASEFSLAEMRVLSLVATSRLKSL